MITFSNLDLLIIIVYLILTLGIGLFASRRTQENTGNFFLAGRSMGWFVIGSSLFVTSVSAEHILGLSASAASNGLIVWHFAWMGIIGVILLGWVFGPLFYKSGVYTIPEYLEKRFNRATRVYLTSVSIITYILTRITVTLFAGGLLLNALLGWDLYTSAVVMVVVTGMYTIVGGLRAVLLTQLVQFFFLLAGAAAITFIGMEQIGGFDGLLTKLPDAHFNIFRPMADTHFPWIGLLLGLPILSVWYWCTDQFVVQRVMGAKNIRVIKKASIYTSILKFLTIILFILTGLISVVLYPNFNELQIHPLLVMQETLPAGLIGLFFAAMLAMIMSSLASVFHSTATLITMDFYRMVKPQSSQRKLVLIGRLVTTGMVIATILWVPVTKVISSQVYLYFQSIQAYIGPPIVAVLVFGIISNAVNGLGAVWSLLTGGFIGMMRLILEFAQPYFNLTNTFLSWFIDLNFLNFAILLFLFSAIILFTLSRFSVMVTAPSGVGSLTKAISNEKTLTIQRIKTKERLHH